MNSIQKKISVYIPFAKSIIQRQMSYKISFFMRSLGGIVQLMIIYYLWNAIFDSSESEVIQGFTRNEMVTYVVVTYLVMQMININIEWIVSEDIQSGSIAMSLIKPVSYAKRILSESLGMSFENTVLLVIPIWIVYNVYQYIDKGVYPTNISTLALFILSLILGYLIIFLFDFIFALSSFYVTYIWGFISCKWMIVNFFSGQLIPINFFPKALKDILGYLPFSGMNYTPVMIYLGKLTTKEVMFSLSVQAAWIVILFGIYKLLWAKSIKKVTVMGG